MPSPGGRSPRWPATSTGAVRSGWEGSGIPSTSRWVTTPRQRAALLRTPNLTSGALTRHGRATRGSYQVTPPSRTRRRHRSRRGRPILAKTATSRQSTEGHTPSERCRPHPISLPTDATNYNVQDRQRSHCPVEEPDRETPDSDSGARRADTQPIRIRTKNFSSTRGGRRAYGGAQFGSRSWQAATGRVCSEDRSNLRIHVSRTVANIVTNSYGSEGWEFESLRARHISYLYQL
jgi:hypothetical protein